MPAPIKVTKALRASFEGAAAAAYPAEACGLVVAAGRRLSYRDCRNTAIDAQDRFSIHPDDWVAAEEAGRIVAVFHTHPDASAHPSLHDRLACEKSGLPWLIMAWPDGTLLQVRPEGWTAPLVGREFAFGVQDCYTLIQDHFQRELSIALPDFEREDGFWERKQLPDGTWQPPRELYLENFEAAGFVAVHGEPKRHDVILMQVAAEVANHGGVYLGDGTMLHHLYGQLSTRVPYAGTWQRHTRLVVRHRSLAGAAP